MKGRLVLVAAVLALALLLPTVAPASGAPAPGGATTRRVNPGLGHAARLRVPAAPEAPVVLRLAAPRLGIISNGPCTITGLVKDFAGQTVEGATVVWGYYDAQDTWVFGNQATTQANGGFSFEGVAATPADAGELDVSLPGGDGYQAWKLTFSAPPATNSFTLQPGVAPFSTTRSSSTYWGEWGTVTVDTWGSQGGATSTVGENGNALVMPPEYSYAVVTYWYNEAIEWLASPSPALVGAGADGRTDDRRRRG